MALDERLRREIERGGEPADPSGVYEDLIRRKERRRIARWTKAGALALIVVLGSTAGIYGLSRVFGSSSGDAASGPANGLIIYSDIRIDGFDGEGINVIDGWHLYTVDPIDGRVTRIGPDSVDEALYPTWSPDGSRIAFVGFQDTAAEEPRSRIFVGDANGSNVEAVFTPADDQQIEGLRWSPDGSRIGYELAEPGSGASSVSPPDRSWTVWTMTPDGAEHRQVTTTGREMHFSWSPDGTRIVFERFAPIQEERELGEAATDLFIVDVESGDEIRITHDGMSRDPAWSPDGEWIAFSLGPRGSQHVALIGADGGGLETLSARAEARTLFPYGNTIAWSPDGGLIAFSGHSSDDVCFISLLDLRDNNVRTLVSSPASASCPGQEGMSWAPAVEPTGSVSPTPTESPSPEPSPYTDVDEDIGLGFPVCNVTSVAGVFAPGVEGTAWVATKTGDVGCPSLGDGMQIVAVDVSGDGVADTSFGPIQCDPWCSAFAAPDVDGDGTDELLIQNIQFTVAGLRLYDVRSDPQEAVAPVTVSSPGYPGEDLAPGAEPQFWIGGDAFDSDSLRCFEDRPPPTGPGRVLIQTSATQVPPDSPDSTWHATETWFDLQPDGTVTIVDRGDFEEPVGSGPPSFAQPNRLCGARLPAPFGG